MNPKRLQDAISNIDDAFIEDAAVAARPYYKIWIPAAALAACILLATALIPWGLIFESDSFVKDPYIEAPVVDVLDHNDDTTSPPVNDTTDSTQNGAEDTTFPPETSDTEDSETIYDPKDTQTPTSGVSPVPDTTGPYTDDTEMPEDEETTGGEDTMGPPVPNDPQIPDHGITVPQRPVILSAPQYPVQELYPLDSALRYEWRAAMDERISTYSNGIGNIDSFLTNTISEFFLRADKGNLIYSPVNAYMSLGMLAEATAGNSRDQLLSLMGANDIYSLRTSASSLWNSCYRNDGIVTSVLGNSVWLDNSFTPNSAVSNILSEKYYASSFLGDMGDEEYDALMHSWINEQTNGFLEDTASSSSLDPESMMSLMSTLYFKADWCEAFDTECTRNYIFHSPGGDVSAPFMYRDFVGLNYVGTNFKSTYLELSEGGEMWFILPDEDVSLESLFSDTEAMGFITGKTQKTLSYKDYSAYMWLFLPKFDINSGVDLTNTLKSIGVTDAFDSNSSDFSTLTDSSIYVRSITQSARICIDENGCEAASASGGTCPDYSDTEPMGFAFDRPFIFVITSDSGIPLFVGTVYDPN